MHRFVLKDAFIYFLIDKIKGFLVLAKFVSRLTGAALCKYLFCPSVFYSQPRCEKKIEKYFQRSGVTIKMKSLYQISFSDFFSLVFYLRTFLQIELFK